MTTSPAELAPAVATLARSRNLASLAWYAVGFVVLVWMGHELRGAQGEFTILWPSSGLLMWMLWRSPRALWPAVIAIQWLSEVTIDWLEPEPIATLWIVVFATADSLEGIVAASLARLWMPAVATARVTPILCFMTAAAVGVAVSATLGAWGAVAALGQSDYLQQWQIWWAGNLLGVLTVAPAVFCWDMRFKQRANTIEVRSIFELIVAVLALLVLVLWVFVPESASVRLLLQLPLALLLLLIYAAFRLPARWTTALSALAVLLSAFLASRGYGPFSTDATRVAGIGALQFFLATLVTVSFMIVTALAELRNTFAQLAQSEERYRAFVARSTEALWRIELDQPMPLDLAPQAQVQWVREHGFIAECNLAYRQLRAQAGEAIEPKAVGNFPLPLSRAYDAALEQAVASGFNASDLRLALKHREQTRHYLLSFAGFESDGRLQRIWGLARDITELVDLNSRLVREQDRLRTYAQQLIGAEERARRATAVDLHDGIGQLLTGLSLTLENAQQQVPPAASQLLLESRRIISDVQSRTRELIADLSPPGLYDLGLSAALQWLSVRLRTADKFRLELSGEINERRVPLELRILAFKLTRELLRNVIKHARVDTAAVTLSQPGDDLKIEVADQGVGFEWRSEGFEQKDLGFGLWSIADRVHAVKGRVQITTAPGRGCKVTITLPLLIQT